jgi:redox-sensitive bicupin YhaK (pirin superfamily)
MLRASGPKEAIGDGSGEVPWLKREARPILASTVQTRGATSLDVLVLRDRTIRQRNVRWEPSVMGSNEEIVKAIEHYGRGCRGAIPAEQIAPRIFA